jgi:hypothetical protein
MEISMGGRTTRPTHRIRATPAQWYLNVAEVEGGGMTTSASTLHDGDDNAGGDAGHCVVSASSNSNDDDGDLVGVFIVRSSEIIIIPRSEDEIDNDNEGWDPLPPLVSLLSLLTPS